MYLLILIKKVYFELVQMRFFFLQKNRKSAKFFFAMRRMTMNVGAFESPDLGGPSRYPQRIPYTPRKVFTAL